MAVDLDLARFWDENALSSGKPFSTDKPRVPISLPVDDHWLIEDMGIPSTVRYYQDASYRADVNRQCNDRCEPAIGRRPFSEEVARPGLVRLERVWGSRVELTEGGTPWLEPAVSTIHELRALMDRMERLSDDEFLAIMLADGAVIEKFGGERGAWNRGPATMGTSIVGTTELMYWLVDYPEDMDRFYELLGDSIVRYYTLLAHSQGSTMRGFSWLDDNCYLFSPSLYERYCLPLMRKVFAAFAPLPGDHRYQHSDSAMEHLLPLLATLDLKGVNFGPTVPVQAIRRAMPRAEIQGEVAPFTLRNGSLDDVVAEVRRDFDAVGGDGGLFVTTSGSIAAGTSLESIRGFMWAVETYCRYDG